MDSNSQVTIAQVIQNVVTQAGLMAAIVAPIVFGVGEALKKIQIKNWQFPSWLVGLLSAPIGVITTFLINGAHFTAVGILVGVLAGLATSGAYSTVKSATAQPTPSVM